MGMGRRHAVEKRKRNSKKQRDAESGAEQAVHPTENKGGEEDDRDVGHLKTWPRYLIRRSHIRSIAKYCPLVSAILAPLSTLMDIPALSQHWYIRDGVAQPDFKTSIVLSAIGLALNVIANVLLVVRFSSKAPFWVNHSTKWSLLFWILKTVVAVANLITFGILSRNQPAYSYSEGFWCAVVSVIVAGIISITLTLHYFEAFGSDKHDTSDVRAEGKKFILSVQLFMAILSIQSLVFCKIENWTYADGIYFSVQTALTIGYGDYHPLTTAGKVLVFPFSVLTISQLGNEIALIIGFISSRADERRNKWRRRYEGAMHREATAVRPRASLTEEMALIHQINAREETMNQLYDLLWSVLALIVFWVIGATAFSQIEGWAYGDAVYVCIILSLTIGFGDFTPATAGGKIVFIVYALMAVPIVTSFAVQTITGMLSTYSERGSAREAFIAEQKRTPEAFAPHSDFVLRYHESYGDTRKRLMGPQVDHPADQGETAESIAERRPKGDESGDDQDGYPVSSEKPFEDGVESEPTVVGEDERRQSRSGRNEKEETPDDGPATPGEKEIEEDFKRVKEVMKEKPAARGEQEAQSTTNDHEDCGEDTGEMEKNERQLEVDMLKQLLQRTIRLEAEARQMLLDSMEQGVARTLLLADRNVQIRDVRALRGDHANVLAMWEGESHQAEHDQEKANAVIDADQVKNSGQATSQEQSKEQLDMLGRVRRYRNTFAEILVIGSILQKLEGEELNEFERWREEEDTELGERDIRVGQDGRPQGEGEDLDKLAEEKWGGLTGRIFQRHKRKIVEKDLGDLAKV
ncbi:hypothetical protein CI109_100549 [Kwoniella shandongensis]|uniref:Potassium channel domain-containing protein n=1 Tax=Kwoniella shandongensis TaxID=1734106 RepID=A0A5M6C0M4_9TREE|nr:uncharacterized protein CI109_003530 [Kwoniella shandongensis]KAA5528241.1 hypothetical protein CI109_003530 [Kwoniella shandongensis]